MPWSQLIRQRLFPILGMEVSPPQTETEIRIEGDVQPVLALLVGKGIEGTVFVEATADGALKMAGAGSGLETYEVTTATVNDAATALGFAALSARLDMTITTYPLDLAFQKADGSWLADMVIQPGSYSIDFSFMDARVNNTVAGQVAVLQSVAWR